MTTIEWINIKNQLPSPCESCIIVTGLTNANCPICSGAVFINWGAVYGDEEGKYIPHFAEYGTGKTILIEDVLYWYPMLRKPRNEITHFMPVLDLPKESSNDRRTDDSSCGEREQTENNESLS